METHRVGGRECIDGTKKIIVEITAQDVKDGDRKVPNACVMAKACSKQFGTEALVHLSRLYLKHKTKDIWTRYLVGPDLRTEIIAYDRGGKFMPGIYELSPPNKSVRFGNRPSSKCGPRKSKSKTPTVLRGIRQSASNK